VIDAYNGTTKFYVFDNQDPLIAAYRRIFPALFQDASQMARGFASTRSVSRNARACARRSLQSLPHTESESIFSTRRRVERRATDHRQQREQARKPEGLDPYYVLMQLPGERQANEFVIILPFHARESKQHDRLDGRPQRRRTITAGLLVYNFRSPRLIDGPVQIEARIDQELACFPGSSHSGTSKARASYAAICS
jgi:uncharacterized membrane protein (UPF0182 family)